MSWQLRINVQSQRPIIYAGASPHIANCGNQTGIPRITMHFSAKDKTISQTWIRFVRIHSKVQTVVKKLTTVLLIWRTRKTERVRHIFEWLSGSKKFFFTMERNVYRAEFKIPCEAEYWQ